MTAIYVLPEATSELAARWWVPVIRGIAAILFGIATFIVPGISLLFLVTLWGAYALADGVINLAHAARGRVAGKRWGWLLFEGIVSVIAGVVTFAWPGMTALALLVVIACWAIITGIAEIAAAIRLRREIQGEWMLAATGVLSITFGVILLMRPGAGALALVTLIGAYAIVFGALLIGLGVRLHRFQHESERAIPAGRHAHPRVVPAFPLPPR